MIAVSFYTVRKKENSTKLPSNPVVMECSIKDDCSVLSPSLIIKAGTNTVPAFNYCHIQEFGRYYWITNWSWVRGVWQCACNVDVLATWRSYIGASNQYILRSASMYDNKLIDSMYPTFPHRTYGYSKLIDISTGNEVDNPFTTDLSKGQYVIGILGKPDNNIKGVGAINYYCFNQAGIEQFMKRITDGGFLETSERVFLNPFQYVISCNWFPFKIASEAEGNKVIGVHFGYWLIGDISESSDKQIYSFALPTTTYTNFNYDISLLRNPQSEIRGEYMNYEPYSKYILSLGTLGEYRLDSTLITGASNNGNELRIKFRVDYTTGDCEISLYYARNYGVPVLRFNSNISASIQLAQITANINSSGISGRKSNAALAIATPIITGLSAIVNGLDQIGSTELGSARNGSIAMGADLVGVRCEFSKLVEENIVDKGRPLCANSQISNLYGYILCSNVELEIPCSADELARIKSYMEGGFYYE